MELFLYILLGVYMAEHLIMFIGLLINLKGPPVKYSGPGEYPSVSVIVAARNEEDIIGRCIDSLMRLDYPDDKMEVILVNDNSDDRTGDIMKSRSEERPNVKYFVPVPSDGRLRGKANALAQAIRTAKGEMIITTDADIEVKPGWVKEMAGYFDGKTGVVSGFSVIQPRDLYWGIQSYDWLYLLSIASGSDGVNHQISCVGNNMGYRRSAYEEVGGYENIKFSVTEDFMLLQAIKKKTRWKTAFPVNYGIVNQTLPCANVREIYRQKKRWARGGLDAHSAGILVGAVAWLTSISLLFGWLFADPGTYLIFLLSKLLIDSVFIFPAAKRFRMMKVYTYIIAFEVYFTLYVLLMPFILLAGRKVVWKGQKF